MRLKDPPAALSILLPAPSHVLWRVAGKKRCQAPPAQRLYHSGMEKGGEWGGRETMRASSL